MAKGFVFRLVLLLLPLVSLQAAEPFTVHNVSGGLNQPWGLALVDQQWALVTEKPGNLVLVNLATGDKQRIYGVPIAKQVGQGGLLDIKLAPDFQQSRWVYFSYSKSVKGGVTTALARARWKGGLQLSELEELLVTNAVRRSTRHFGSRLAFDHRGYLYMTIGDRGHRKLAQDLSRHAGKVLRLNADGSVPKDNPFVGRKDVMAEIYTYGHRNPQGLAFDPVSQRMWLHEHGPRGGDEVNILKAGANYGWPLQTFGREYSGLAIKNAAPEDTVMPKWHWTPSIAPSGLAVYRGDAFPQWRGDLLVGALLGLGMVHLETTQEQVDEEQRFFEAFGQRIRTIEVGKGGEIYLLTDSSDGQLLRLDPVVTARSSSFRESIGRQ
ncbi:PQQ-dependent sugar dehydrogenase [Maricurvus nonylphenolicus]|uniref:PQQ-dependent sugar dehydrogenase n=1 Tax=Maricurvus nonylphenolicus TaxID=1008307 RepID=UPI0036F1FE82